MRVHLPQWIRKRSVARKLRPLRMTKAKDQEDEERRRETMRGAANAKQAALKHVAASQLGKVRVVLGDIRLQYIYPSRNALPC